MPELHPVMVSTGGLQNFKSLLTMGVIIMAVISYFMLIAVISCVVVLFYSACKKVFHN